MGRWNGSAISLVTAIVLAGLAGAGAVSATEPEPAPVVHDIAELGWMAGTWSGTAEGVTMEEHWMPPGDGLMVGVHRDLRPGRPPFFEFLRIEARPDGVFYMASPRGRDATPFKLASLEHKRVVFENPEHDYPQRIIYWAEGEDILHARIEGTNDGKEGSSEWSWKRVD